MGIYRFYQDGVLVGEHNNVLTVEGKTKIYRYLAQIDAGYARSMSFGIGTTTATSSDTELEFEVARLDITQSAPNFADETVVFKTRLPRGLDVQIREAGLWSDQAVENPDGVVAFVSEEDWDAGTFETDNSRFGGEALRLSATSSNTTAAVLFDRNVDLSEMNATQEFKLAAFVADNNCGAITLRLRTDDLNYFQFSQASPSSGYGIFKFAKKDAIITGSPDWAEINEVYVSVSGSGGTTNVDLDALRTERDDPADPDTALVSRSVLGTPVVKAGDSEMEVEYELGVTIN